MSDIYTLRTYLMRQLIDLDRYFDLTIVSYQGGEEELEKLGIKAEIVHLQIERNISIFKDIQALFGLWRFFRRRRFDIVQSYTPKPGMLGMVAACIAGVPIRVHWFLGQVWVTKSGIYRYILKIADRLTAIAATNLFVDSPSQLAFLRAEGVVKGAKAEVILKGSICGVDCARFAPRPERRTELRREWGIPEFATVYLYMARLTRDKGAIVIAEAFRKVAAESADAYLMIVGPDDENLTPTIRHCLSSAQDRLRMHGFTHCPEDYFSASDVLCLPSFREGFGLVLINAGAAGMPAIASRIYGSIDAIVEGETGLLHDPGDHEELARLMLQVHQNPEYRHRLGAAGMARAASDFSQEIVTKAVTERYLQLTEAAKGLKAGA